MPPTLDKPRLEAVVTAVADRLPGDWLLLGGALVSLWLDARRTTGDLDVVGLGGTLQERYALLRLAGELGLPVESINSAADFFLEQIPGWREEIVPWRRGNAGTIWRPSATLFLLLKAGRLSGRDLADCEAAIARATAEGLPLDRERVRTYVGTLPATGDAALATRRERLIALLD